MSRLPFLMAIVVVISNNTGLVGPVLLINLYYVLGLAHNGRSQESFGLDSGDLGRLLIDFVRKYDYPMRILGNQCGLLVS